MSEAAQLDIAAIFMEELPFNGNIGPHKIKAIIQHHGFGQSSVKIYLKQGDNISLDQVLTEDMVIQVAESNKARYLLIQTSMARNRVFLDMICASIQALYSESRPEALTRMAHAISEFLEFFAQRKSLMLSEGRQRGLIGELLILEKVLSFAENSLNALTAWTGPLSLPQDFQFKSSIGIEVKTRAGLKNSVIISNEDQLDDAGGKKIFLCVFPVKPDPSGISLIEAIDKCASKLEASMINQFYSKLHQCGLHKWTIPFHNEYRISTSPPEIYWIKKGKGVITRASIPEAASNVSYELNLSGLQQSQCNIDEFIKECLK